jgi:hypothetical protein
MSLDRVSKWSGPMRFLIDSMIVDAILDTPGLLAKIQDAHARGAVIIVETHLLKDQLSGAPSGPRREQLLAVYEALPKQHVATSGFVLGVSRLGAAALSDEAGAASLDRLKTSGRGGLQDALLAMTATGHADALVTEDIALAKRAMTEKLNVCSFASFRAYVETVTSTDGVQGG